MSSSVVSRFSSKYAVTRQVSAEQMVSGLRVAPEFENFDILAVIQPLTGMGLLILPEGERTKESVRIFTNSELQVANQESAKKGDVVSYRGKSYEVQATEDWAGIPGTTQGHYKFIGQLVEADS